MARRALITLDVETQDARENLARLRGVFPKLSSDAVASVEAVEDAFGGLGPVIERNVQRTSDSLRRLNRATANANQVLFTAGDAVQDIGIAFQLGASTTDALGKAARFAGNNIAFGAEQISLLVAQAGSGRAALSALAGSILGAGGVILGLQLLISVLPQVIELLSGAEREAKEYEKALKEISVIKIENPLEEVEFGIGADDIEANLNRLREAAEVLEQIEERLFPLLRSRARTPEGVFTPPIGLDLSDAATVLRVSEEQLRNALRSQEAARELLVLLEAQGRAQEDIGKLLEANRNQRNELLESERGVVALANEILSARIAGVGSGEREVDLTKEQIKALEEQLVALGDVAGAEAQIQRLLQANLLTAQQAAALYARVSDRIAALRAAPPAPGRGRPSRFDPEETVRAVREWARRVDMSDIGPQIRGAPPDTGFLPDEDEIDRRASHFARTLRALQADWQLIQAEAEAGLLDPFGKAQAEVNNLRAQLQNMLEAGIDPADAGFQELLQRFREAEGELARMALSMQAIGELSRGIGDQVSFAILGDPAQVERLEQRRQRLEERIAEARIRMSESEGEAASRLSRHIHGIQEDLDEVNKELERFETLQGRIAEGFARLGNVARGILGQMISDLTTAAARFALLQLIPGVGQGVTFGSTLLNVVGFATGGAVTGPTFAMVGEEASLSNPEVIVPLDRLQGMIGGNRNSGISEFRIRGADLVAALEEQRRYNRRLGMT